MIPIKPFEIAVLRKMTDGVLLQTVLEAALLEGEFISYEYTEYGYYLSFRHSQFPMERIVCAGPPIIAASNGIEAGFEVFIEAREVTLECFPIGGEPPIPEGFREQVVELREE